MEVAENCVNTLARHILLLFGCFEYETVTGRGFIGTTSTCTSESRVYGTVSVRSLTHKMSKEEKCTERKNI